MEDFQPSGRFAVSGSEGAGAPTSGTRSTQRYAGLVRGFSFWFLVHSASPLVPVDCVNAEWKSVSGNIMMRRFIKSAAPPAARPTGVPKKRAATDDANPVDCATITDRSEVSGSKVDIEGSTA